MWMRSFVAGHGNDLSRVAVFDPVLFSKEADWP